MSPARLLGLLLIAVFAWRAGLPAQQLDPLDEAFRAFWEGESTADQELAVNEILGLGPSFDAVWTRLQRGRPYSDDVATGRRLLTTEKPFHYAILVPDDYDPGRRYPVMVYLHGGVGRPSWRKNGNWWHDYDSMKNSDRISVFPAAWDEAMWWEWNQVQNLARILEELRRFYNVDENRVFLLGISDGGSGVYFHAFRQATPWAAFLPFVGCPSVLNHPDLRVDGQLYVPNLRNRPLFVVNAELDRLYPSRIVLPFIELFQRQGVDVTFRDKIGYGHGMRWWPEEEEAIEEFLQSHPRDPLTTRIVWETERPDRYGRIDWLVIQELALGEEVVVDEANVIRSPGTQPMLAFGRDRPSGRVELVAQDNQITVQTRGVRRYQLLLSPDRFDLSRPITVTTNGVQSFQGLASPDVATLLRHAVEDQDRTMLFGAELEIEVDTARP